MKQALLPTHADNAADETLIQAALDGSKTALERLLTRHYTFIYNVALRFVLNPADAEDLTQETILKVITRLARFRHQSDFRTWLYRIVFNHFLTSKRRKMEQVVLHFDDYGDALDAIPAQVLTEQEQADYRETIEEAKIGCMTGMLLCLNREQRLVYILGELFAIDSPRGAELLGLSADNFRQLLSRGRKDLYNFMNNQCGLVNTRNPCRCPKKTKGFIQAGWVNANDLQFSRGFIQKIAALAVEKVDQCDQLLDEKYASLFKDHPYYDKDKTSDLLATLTQDAQLRSVFDL